MFIQVGIIHGMQVIDQIWQTKVDILFQPKTPTKETLDNFPLRNQVSLLVMKNILTCQSSVRSYSRGKQCLNARHYPEEQNYLYRYTIIIKSFFVMYNYRETHRQHARLVIYRQTIHHVHTDASISSCIPHRDFE